MDGSAVDRLARSIVTGGTRRWLLGLLSGLPLAGIPAPGDDPDEAIARGRTAHRHQAQHEHRHAKSQRRKAQSESRTAVCIVTGKRCPQKIGKHKHAKKVGCDQCCVGFSTVDTRGNRVCGCQPDGGACTSARASLCCSGYCDGGVCRQTPPDCAHTCDGCCDGAGVCQAGTSDAACGAAGAVCTSCSGSTPICSAARACICTSTNQCPANTICDPSGACLPCDLTCPSSPCTGNPVQAFIDAHPSQTVFRICPGTYVGNFGITRGLTLIGAGDEADESTNTILQGAGSNSVVFISANNQDVMLGDLRLTGGGGMDVSGGGILHTGSGGTLTMADCTISINTSGFLGNGGGGIYFSGIGGSTASLTRCTISDNHDPGIRDGGGIANFGQMTLTDCVLSGNSSTNLGGGIFSQGTLTLHGTIVGPNNTASGSGGGIFSSAGGITLDEGTIVCGNDAPSGPQCAGFSSPACGGATCPP